MPHRKLLSTLMFIGAFVALMLCIPTGAQQPPASQPSVAVDAGIARMFGQLNDPDPKIRDQSKTDLMGISRDQLPQLRQLVSDNQPVNPAQVAALRDIVTQVYLTEEPYTGTNGEQTNALGKTGPFFLGVHWEQLDEDPARLGVPVDERLPGFPSFRFLRKGDMIEGCFIDPAAPLLQLPNMETHNRTALINAIGSAPGAQNIVLQVLRNGESIKVSVTMAPRPAVANGNNFTAMSTLNSIRIDKADAYWEQNFAPLVDSANNASNLAQGR